MMLQNELNGYHSMSVFTPEIFVTLAVAPFEWASVQMIDLVHHLSYTAVVRMIKYHTQRTWKYTISPDTEKCHSTMYAIHYLQRV